MIKKGIVNPKFIFPLALDHQLSHYVLPGDQCQSSMRILAASISNNFNYSHYMKIVVMDFLREGFFPTSD